MSKMKVNLVSLDITGRYRNPLAISYLRAFGLNYQEIESEIEFNLLNLQSGVDQSILFNFCLARIMGNNPDVIGFSAYLWSIELIYKMAEAIKKISPRIRIVLGGSEVSSLASKILAEHPDIDVIGHWEGEITFSDLLLHYLIDIRKPPNDVDGITYRDGEDIFTTQPRKLIEDLDCIPSPYLNNIIQTGTGRVLIETLRGCPFNCSYCVWGPRKLRFFSEDRICQELDFIFSSFHNPVLYFIDSAININPKRGKIILKHLIDFSKKHELRKKLVLRFSFSLK